jgi:uncharacterized protein (DUF305 family)
METRSQKNIRIAVAMLVAGLFLGYFIGMRSQTKEISNDSHSSMHTTMDSMTATLSGKTGDVLDKAFLDEMIVHHEGAIEMAALLLAGSKRPELIKLAKDIIAAQTREVQMMKEWRSQWFVD